MKYERFQILSSSRQELFCPESPVWVSRVQLSLDRQSGKRLLQVRMVNCSDRSIRRVFLRVICLGAGRERLAQLELLPLPELAAGPGRVFGDDKPVALPVKGAVYAEVYAQRVRFADGSAWDESEGGACLAFRAEAVRPTDPHYEILAARARAARLRNDCYFRSQQGLWVCTCGLPNSQRRLRCPHCGADRLWLERSMDVERMEAPEPVRASQPAPVDPPPPVQPAPVVPAPIRTDPAPARPTFIVQAPPEPAPAPDAGERTGRIAALVLALLLFLALGVFCALRWVNPWLRYRTALERQAAGDYEQAAEGFRGLGDYRDSPEQLRRSLSRKGLTLMGEERYREALEIFEALEGEEARVADCLYALGVQAYNGKDPETAMEYVRQLRERFPEYDGTETLEQYSAYSLGSRAGMEAGAAASLEKQIEGYNKAIEWFEAAKGYEDSAERITECRYQVAQLRMELGETTQAIALFEELGGYKDAARLRQDCMYQYLLDNLDSYHFSAVASSWLNELTAAEYPGAQELYERLNGLGFRFQLSDAEGGEPETIHDLSELYISYSVESRDEEGPVLVLIRYRLPDGREGRALLNADRSAQGRLAWKDIPFPVDCDRDGELEISFYDARLGENGFLLDIVSIGYSRAEQGGAAEAADDESPDTSGG